MRPLLNKVSLDASNLGYLVASIQLGGRVLEWVVAMQLQAVLEKTDAFQSRFRPVFGVEMAFCHPA